MPVRPENRDRYPADWAAISARIRYERAENRCEECGVRNHALGGRDKNGRWHRAQALDCGGRMPAPGTWAWCEGGLHLRIIRIVLTVAHLDHKPENCADANLRAMCQRCHNLDDQKARRAGMLQRARAAAVVAELPL